MGMRSVLIMSIVVAVVALWAPAASALAADKYSWSITCRGNSTVGAYWYWLQDGQPIVGSDASAGCIGTDSLSGGGDRPASATGIFVQLAACAYDVCDYQSVTVTFVPSGAFLVSLKSSARWSGNVCERPSCYVKESYRESGTFTMN